MNTGPAIIDPRVNAMIREFAASRGFAGMPDHRMIYRSEDFPETRQVWQVVLGPDIFALKLDHEAEPDGRLAKEYGELEKLRAHFAKYDKLDLVTPVYLSPTGRFCVTEYIDFLTAGQRLQAVDNDQTRKQVFRRAGLWLHALHEYHPIKRKEYWGNWMPIEVDNIVAAGDMQADPAQVAVMRDKLKAQIRKVNKIKDSHAWSHGDYHAENLMLGPGATYGFDFTEARRKMAVYDIVDFLKVDIWRKSPISELDGAGITKLHRQMFFKGYKHPINKDVLDVSLRGRLLIDWVSITRENHATREDRRTIFDRLKTRLDVSFGRR